MSPWVTSSSPIGPARRPALLRLILGAPASRRRLLRDRDRRALRHEGEDLLHLRVPHADAAGAHLVPDRIGKGRAVDPETVILRGALEPEPSRPEDVLRVPEGKHALLRV